MKIATPAQMGKIDSVSINRFGIPGIVLMENAALKVVEEIKQTLETIGGKTVYIFAGKGNNGGDAFAVARHLYNKGARVKVFVTADKSDIKGDAEINLKILENMKVQVEELTREQQLKKAKNELADASLVIDGIFGTGLKGNVRGIAGSVIDMVNASGKTVIAIDIPSGVSGETGQVLGKCIRADKTVTFALPKIGLIVHPGCEFSGELVTADIGIPAEAIDEMDIKTHLIDMEYVMSVLPARKVQSNKGDYGKVLVITGSPGMTGAGILAGSAALRTGAGLVYMGVPSSLANVYDACLTEAVTIPLEDNGSGCLSDDSIKQAVGQLRGKTVAAIGPGLSVNEGIVKLLGEIISNSDIPLVLDADALNAISRDVQLLAGLKAEAVLTPHPGEMSRLTGMSIEEIQNDRIGAAREFSCKWNVIVVLKGSRTVVAMPDGTVYINPTGNSGMATGGSGDVLTGIISGLISQGLKPSDAAIAGVYIHGQAGDRAAEEKGEYGMIAGDILSMLPGVMKSMRG